MTKAENKKCLCGHKYKEHHLGGKCYAEKNIDGTSYQCVCKIFVDKNSRVEQLGLTRQPHELEIGGSNPPSATNDDYLYGKKVIDRENQREKLDEIKKEITKINKREYSRIPEIREKYKVYMKTYKLKHPDVIKNINEKNKKKYYEMKKNPELWAKHIEQQRIYAQKYYQQNKEKYNKSKREKYKNDEKYRKRRQLMSQKYNNKIKEKKQLTSRQQSIQDALEVWKNIVEDKNEN